MDKQMFIIVLFYSYNYAKKILSSNFVSIKKKKQKFYQFYAL